LMRVDWGAWLVVSLLTCTPSHGCPAQDGPTHDWQRTQRLSQTPPFPPSLPQKRAQLKSFKGSADYPLLRKAHELAEPIAKGARTRGCSPETAALMWLAAIARGAPPCRGRGGEQEEWRVVWAC
jgi:hypothetical protein